MKSLRFVGQSTRIWILNSTQLSVRIHNKGVAF